MTRAVVFAGPSIDAATIAGLAPVEVRPPVKRGDIDLLLAEPEPVTHIGIIDGQFLQGLMISPKEVLRALDRHAEPVRVFGSSSMGALRAAELVTEGMVGVGQVFEMYRSGAVDADDEVAITFDPGSLRALCEPMVNIRVAIAAAVAGGVVSPGGGEAVLSAAKGQYFPDRTYDLILRLPEVREAVGGAELAALRDFLAADAPDAKREDAVELLRRLDLS
ncbi:TfuA-like protein [Actinomadura oligospora]|uniref:TfuA-like protein n=1 Tax=Actinomadura oligospora TaxID=111804 RepID=UPI00047BEFA0|nr:TfuA-like protein [Actinomadura oligospora]